MDDAKKTGGSPAISRGEKSGRVFTLTFTLPKFVFCLVVGGLLVSWSFIFGVMLGRGYAPEENFPALAELMPQGTDASSANGENNGLLRPDELAYHATLKGPETPARPGGAPNTASPSPQPAPAAPQLPVSPRPAQPETPPPASRTATPAPAAAPPAATATQTGERFDYVYQVAAFKDTASAERLLTRLKSAGLNAEITNQEQNGTIWYRAMVRFRGTPDDVQSLRDALAPMGINQILMKSKTAAGH